jgi:hypothetical protein
MWMNFDRDEGWAIVQAFLEAMDGVAYLADAGGVIRAFGGAATPLFRESGNGPAPKDTTKGANLFDVICGEEVKAAYRRVHDTVLGARSGYVGFDYRCDAPDVRRSMRMSITRFEVSGGSPFLLYQSQVLSAVARPWMSLFEPHRIVEYRRQDSGLPIVRMCSFCQQVRWPDDAGSQTADWIEAETYYRRGGPSEVQVSHGLCPSCAPNIG